MDTSINPYAGDSHIQGAVPPHYDSVQEKGQVNSNLTAGTSSSAVEIIPDHDDMDEDPPAYADLYKLSPHVPISYGNTFKESSSIRGFPFMTKVNEAIYHYTHFALYASLTLIIGPVFSFVWAIFFALFHISIIWFVQPTIKVYYVWMRIWGLLFSPSVRLFLDPIFRSISLVLSNIKGIFKMTAPDVTVNVKTTQV